MEVVKRLSDETFGNLKISNWLINLVRGDQNSDLDLMRTEIPFVMLHEGKIVSPTSTLLGTNFRHLCLLFLDNSQSK